MAGAPAQGLGMESVPQDPPHRTPSWGPLYLLPPAWGGCPGRGNSRPGARGAAPFPPTTPFPEGPGFRLQRKKVWGPSLTRRHRESPAWESRGGAPGGVWEPGCDLSRPASPAPTSTSGPRGAPAACPRPLWPRRLPGASLPALGPCSEAGSLPSIWPWPRGVRGRAPVRGWRGVQIWSTARPWALAAPARSPTPTASDGRRAVSGARGAGSRGQGGGVGRRAPEIREWSRDGAPRVQV